MLNKPLTRSYLSLRLALPALYALVAILAFNNIAIAGYNAVPVTFNPSAQSSLNLSAPTAYPTTGWGRTLVYDSKLGYGFADSGAGYRLANDTWQKFSLPLQPFAESFSCVVYDPATGNIILFGGASKGGAFNGIGFAESLSNTTWYFSSSGWQNITASAGTPLTVKYPACAYDPSIDGGAIIMFGGATSSYEHNSTTWLMNDTNETWVYAKLNGSFKWIQLHPLVSPSARFGAAMVFDSATKQLIMYGGAENGTSTANGSCTNALCPHLHDTWLFSGNLKSSTWIELNNGTNASDSPAGSIFTGIAYDPLYGNAVIEYGGQINGYKSANATSSSTWRFNTTTDSWANLTGSVGVVPSRFSPLFAYDPKMRSVVLYSGLSGTLANSPIRSDMWEFSNNTWNIVNPITFNEIGLASGTEWNITTAGATQFVTSPGGKAIFDLVKGKYKYSIENITGYNSIKGKSYTVNAPATITINFKDS